MISSLDNFDFDYYDYVVWTLCRNWGFNMPSPHIKRNPLLINPASVNYLELTADIDSSRVGEFTMNTDMANMPREYQIEENLEFLNLPSFEGRPIYEVMAHVGREQSSSYYVPDISMLHNLEDHRHDKYDLPLRVHRFERSANKYNMCFGTLIRRDDGVWCVPSVFTTCKPGRRIGIHALGQAWSSRYSVMLFRKLREK